MHVHHIHFDLAVMCAKNLLLYTCANGGIEAVVNHYFSVTTVRSDVSHYQPMLKNSVLSARSVSAVAHV